MPFDWPRPPFRIVLVEPEIPANTGNIARLCAGVGSPLHLVGQLGFRVNDKDLKRAGLDYWDSVDLSRHVNFEAFVRDVSPPRMYFFSTRGRRNYMDVEYQPGDALVFGSEQTGLADELVEAERERVLCIPMKADAVRSLNLANAVSIVLYEALRQCREG
ncbi:MAG: tRNA (uridine(34)/cytosine(34)/5-carboxymethylaminomethyluridine(34)-2'-O)-methyltransferase TrmL [Verrucomicrobia bacterium]|nr:tRNA (uridine(34)/cytosine(34)/5-carboxymethylaminomethyluridine(34)-2'-O)-methyltransferase TrmL [Verrucomicrobiota bacterium]